MADVNLITFDEALVDSDQYSKRHLLLGNGFSIGCCPDIFHYASLYKRADFSKQEYLREVFKQLDVEDFEIAIRSLERASKVLPVYLDDSKLKDKIADDAEILKEILVSTIASNHPDKPNSVEDEKFWACRQFLNHFLGDGRKGHVYTLNYDLLLYWTLMHDDMPFNDTPLKLNANDSFGNDEDDPDTDYVVWQGETAAHSAHVFFLHGALHLFDAGAELKKYTWIRKGTPLVEQAREAITNNAFPLFVAEGSSEKKKEKIRHNAYLYQGYKQLTANASQGKHCFFIYGHSMHSNDDHILLRLARGRFPKLYVGLYGDPSSPENQAIINRSNELAALRNDKYPLDVAFYDTSTANVWG